MVNKFTLENFETEVEKGEGTVLVDFYADWCGPCKMMSPIVDKIAEEMPEIKVGKVNCDDETELAQKYGIMSIPSLLIFRSGKLEKTFIGVQPKEQIIEALK